MSSLSPLTKKILSYIKSEDGPVKVKDIIEEFSNQSVGAIKLILENQIEDRVEKVAERTYEYKGIEYGDRYGNIKKNKKDIYKGENKKDIEEYDKKVGTPEKKRDDTDSGPSETTTDESETDESGTDESEQAPSSQPEEEDSSIERLLLTMLATSGEDLSEKDLAERLQDRGRDVSFFEIRGLLDELKDLIQDPFEAAEKGSELVSSKQETDQQVLSGEGHRLATVLQASSKVLIPLVISEEGLTVNEIHHVLSKLGEEYHKPEILLSLRAVLSRIVERGDGRKWYVPDDQNLDPREDLFSEADAEKEEPVLKTSEQFIDHIEDWLDGSENAVIPSSWLHEYWGTEDDEKLTREEAHALSGFLEGYGFGVEPDIRHGGHPSKCEHVVVFRQETDTEPTRDRFESARLLLELGSAVAAADGEITDEEELRIEQHLEEALYLNPTERTRLRAHLERRLKHPPELGEIQSKASRLSEEEQRLLLRFLVTIAGADGVLQEEELVLLQDLYSAFGLSQQLLEEDLDELSASSSETEEESRSQSVEVEEGGTERSTSPENKQTTSSGENSEIELSSKKIEQIQTETREVADVLGRVFEEPDSERKSEIGKEGLIEENGLNESYVSLISTLGTRSTWPREKFDEVAEEHGLMPGFVFEEVNQVAFEKSGEPLLEGEDPVEINANALESLKT
jgi:tellurite resistance protein